MREKLDYNTDTGVFTWKKTHNKTRIGKQAGFDISGYVYINICGKTYPAHRLVFLYMDGHYPVDCDIDHINMVRNDNRYENLRLATRSQNMQNIRAHKDSTTGVKNVSYRKDTKSYSVRMMVDGKYRNFGCFRSKEEAETVADKIRRESHKEFANS